MLGFYYHDDHQDWIRSLQRVLGAPRRQLRRPSSATLSYVIIIANPATHFPLMATLAMPTIPVLPVFSESPLKWLSYHIRSDLQVIGGNFVNRKLKKILIENWIFFKTFFYDQRNLHLNHCNRIRLYCIVRKPSMWHLILIQNCDYRTYTSMKNLVVFIQQGPIVWHLMITFASQAEGWVFASQPRQT